jgi:sugar phosphate isomerase/epimerase
MKISCTPISYSVAFGEGSMDVERFINLCAEEGCDAVDLMHTSGYDWAWKDPASQKPKVAGWLQAAGIQLAAIGCGNNFARADAVQAAAAVEAVEGAVQLAAELGAPVVRIFGGHLRDFGDGTGDSATGLGMVLAGLEKALPSAEQHRVVLALENHGGLPGFSYEIGAILRHFDSPFLQCCFDVGNFMANNMPAGEHEDPLRAWERLKDDVAHVHFKDHEGGAGCVAGEGDVPLRQFVAAAEASGFDGYHSLEYEGHRRTPEAEGVPQSLAYFRQLRVLHDVI